MFAEEPLSVSEGASRSSFELRRFHYYVQRLLKADLLRVESVRKRAGRPIKLYRAVASAFYVPSEVLSRRSTDGIAQELRHLLQQDEVQATAGILVSLGANMEPKVEFVTAEGRKRNGFELWRILRLRRENLGRLRRELDEVLSRYQNTHDEKGQVYLVHAAGALRERYEGVVDNG